jgi:hypothetical protein
LQENKAKKICIKNLIMSKPSYLGRFIAVLAVVTMIFAMSSCHSSDEDQLDAIYELIGDDATIAATCDLGVVAGINDDDNTSLGTNLSLPIQVFSRTVPVIRDFLASIRGYRGIEVNHAVAFAYSLQMPSDNFAIIMPVKNMKDLDKSLKSRRFTNSDHGDFQIYRRKSTDGLAVVVYDGLAWFVCDDIEAALKQNVKAMIERGTAKPISDWKRDLLSADKSACVLIKHKIGNIGGEYSALTMDIKDQNFTFEGCILDANGAQTAFDKAENFRYIDPATVAKIDSSDSFFSAAFAMPKSVDSRRIVESIIGNPDQSDVETDSLRATLRHIVDNVDGTLALSLGIYGDDLLDLDAYDFDLACKMLPGKSDFCLKRVQNLLKVWGLTPTQTSASSVLYDFADAKIRLQAEADDYLTVRLDGRPRKKTAPHKFDATDLIGYVVVDIPQNSQIAVVMESNTRLQAQVRITPKGFVFNMSGNDEAADFLLTMLSLLS